MDDRRFDALTRSLARATSRRAAIKGLVGGVIGSAALSHRLLDVGAQASCASSADCGPCMECQENVCVDCGLCETCVEGVCVTACAGDDVCCFGECVAPRDCCSPDFDIACTHLGGCCLGYKCCPDRGECVPDYFQCCTDEPCGACGYCDSNGVCQNRCDPATQNCCPDDGSCIPADECCPGTNVCSECKECVQGECVFLCTDEEMCCDGVCAPRETCCIPNGDHCRRNAQGNMCCSGFCCGSDEHGENELCTECCGDSDCGPCKTCVNGVCTPVSGCCIAADGQCALDGPGCCDELRCCELGDVSICAECCLDSDCGHDGSCDNGACVYPERGCTSDQECPGAACCCADGACSSRCCTPKPPPPSSSEPSDGPVTTLPATGSGNPPEPDGLPGVAALGAAAAVIVAAQKLREAAQLASRDERSSRPT